MSELSGTAAFGIEDVSWQDGGHGLLTVRVTGHWRRRRPASGGPTMLVIEAEGQRQRFPALPEPPSLTGASSPGVWRLSFSVPGRLAPALGGQAWLAVGGVTVPLAVPGAPLPAAPEAEVSRAPAAARLDELERALAAEREARERADARLREGEHLRRRAEQRAHAEEAQRLELASKLAAGAERSTAARRALGELAAAEERIRELETRLAEAERSGDEAERVAAAALAARRRAEGAGGGAATGAAAETGVAAAGTHPPPSVSGAAERARLRFEAALRVQARAARARVPAEPAGGGRPVSDGAAPVGGGRPVSDGAAPGLDEPTILAALRRELAIRARGEAALRARAIQAEARLAARILLERRTASLLRDLRSELGSLRSALGLERERREAAERETERLRGELGGQRDRSRDAYAAIAELREQIEQLRPSERAEAPPPAEARSTAVSSDALSDALSRLRRAAPPSEPAPALEEPEEAGPAAPGDGERPPAAGPLVPHARPTIRRAFGQLVRRDAGLAGRLLVELLGAQGSVAAGPVAYDLILGAGHGVLQVTVPPQPAGSERPAVIVERGGAARAREQVSFQVTGDPDRVARRLVARPLRRFVRLGLARVRGSRDGLAVLGALLELPLDLDALARAGAELQTDTMVGLLAAAIDPAWTRGERFTLAFEDGATAPVYLCVGDGGAPLVTRAAPAGRIAATVSGSAASLAAWLAGDPDPGAAERRGDPGPAALFAQWATRAQSG